MRRADQSQRRRLWDDITRDHCLRRIRFLRNTYRLHWLVDQHAFDTPGMDSLEDRKLSALLKDMERARECLHEGIPLEDAGLVQNMAEQLPCDTA